MNPNYTGNCPHLENLYVSAVIWSMLARTKLKTPQCKAMELLARLYNLFLASIL